MPGKHLITCEFCRHDHYVEDKTQKCCSRQCAGYLAARPPILLADVAHKLRCGRTAEWVVVPEHQLGPPEPEAEPPKPWEAPDWYDIPEDTPQHYVLTAAELLADITYDNGVCGRVFQRLEKMAENADLGTSPRVVLSRALIVLREEASRTDTDIVHELLPYVVSLQMHADKFGLDATLYLRRIIQAFERRGFLATLPKE